jgi:signal transduction histidine kinase
MEPVPRGAIVIVDDDEQMGTAVCDAVSAQFGQTHRIVKANGNQEAATLLASLQEDEHLAVPAIAVSAHVLLREPSSWLPEARKSLGAEAIAYADMFTNQRRQEAIDAGVSACVHPDDVEAAVHSVLLEKELKGLDESVPILSPVMNRIGVGISIQNPQMNIVWCNDRTKLHVDERNRTALLCWMRYHGFYRRECACAGCTAQGVLERAARQRREGMALSDEVLRGRHLLPVHGKIECVEVNGAPLISRDGRKVLAVIEATRLVTAAWKSTPAHDRLQDVIAYARLLGQEREQALPFDSVAVYDRAGKGDEWHLFDVSTGEHARVPKMLRLGECPAGYRAAVEDREGQFFAVGEGHALRRHFVWAAPTSSIGAHVLLDVVYAEEKPNELFTDDLRPYWEYVVGSFEAARDSREQEIRQTANVALQEFLASVAKDIRDQNWVDLVLQSAVECVQKALKPVSMYIRTLDRESGTFVKRSGFGPYYEMIPDKRELRREKIAFPSADGTRRGIWTERADVDELRRCLDRGATPDEQVELERIASHVTMPLLCMDRVLGTLCIQFEDHSLYSDAKRGFIEALATALGGTLGNLLWAHERAALVTFSADLDRLMFRRSDRPEEEEGRVLAQITRTAFELTSAEVVAYYRYDPESGSLTQATGATSGTPPTSTVLPEVVRPYLGITSLAASNKQGYRASDYRRDERQAIREGTVASLSAGPEEAFGRWVGCEIAEPVIAGETVKGVLVALNSIPGWLSDHDVQVVREFACKTGLFLEAKYLTRQLNWHLRTKIYLNDLTTTMARTSDLGTLYRLFLLAITTHECLGFSRAILFLRQDRDGYKLTATEAVGARSASVAQMRWQEADAVSLRHKMDACAQHPQTRSGDLREVILHRILDLEEGPEMLRALKDGRTLVRRWGQPHPIKDTGLRAVLWADGNVDCEYAIVPLLAAGDIAGAVLVDRAFLPSTDHENERLELLQFLTPEFAVVLEAVKLRHEEQEAKAATELARDVSYSLRTRAAALEGRLSNFAHVLGGAHKETIDRLKRAARFFGRAGTVASKLLRLEEIGVGSGEKLDLNEVLSEMDVMTDARINLVRADKPVRVQAERHLIEDVFLELLWNAKDFTDPETGRITVTVQAEDGMARVDCIDNGPGIHPDFRPHLFKRFKCNPASRMGLGLSYAERLVKAYEGTITEIGTWQRGAHFVVRFPLAKGDQDE